MESLTPVKMLTGVRKGDSRVAGCAPQIITITGILDSHQVHSTVTAFITPVYNSAPKGVLCIWIIQSREGELTLNVWICELDREIGCESGKRMLNLKKFRSNDCLIQLKIMGIVFRRGIQVYRSS
jgi:hypothetical protein